MHSYKIMSVDPLSPEEEFLCSSTWTGDRWAQVVHCSEPSPRQRPRPYELLEQAYRGRCEQTHGAKLCPHGSPYPGSCSTNASIKSERPRGTQRGARPHTGNTHLDSLPVSRAPVALMVITFKRTHSAEGQMRLGRHGDHLPAVVPLTPGLVRRCPTLSVTEGDVNLSVFSQHLNAAGDKQKIKIYQKTVTGTEHEEGA